MLFNLKVLAYLDVLLILGLVAFRAALLPNFRSIVSVKVVALVLATPVVALFSGNAYIFHAYLICAVAFTSRTRMELCATYLLMLPMAPALQVNMSSGGVYVLALRSFTAMNIGVLIGMMITRGRVRRTDPGLNATIALLVSIFIFIDIRGANATTIGRVAVETLLLLVPPFLLVSRSVVDAEGVRRLLLSLCLAAFLGAIVAVFGALRHWDLYEPFYSSLNVEQVLGSTALSVRGGRMRTGGPLLDYTAFGLFLAVVAVTLPALRRAFTHQGFLWVCAGVLAGLFATQSRGAWVGLVVGYIALQWLRGRATAALAMAGGGVAAYVVLGVILRPESQLAQTLGISGAATGTVEYRQRLLSLGLEQVRAHPWTGQSPSSLTAALSDLVQGQHIVDFVNTHLYVAMTAGLFAAAAWIACWLIAVVRLANRRHRSESSEHRRSGLLVTPAAMIVTTFVALTFTSTIDRNLYWLLLAAGFATPILAGRPGRSASSPEPTARQSSPALLHRSMGPSS